jgi:hypothetical protein
MTRKAPAALGKRAAGAVIRAPQQCEALSASPHTSAIPSTTRTTMYANRRRPSFTRRSPG